MADEAPGVDDAVLARLVRDLGDGVVIADRTGAIVYWNHAAQGIFGWTAAEALGRNLDLIIPERNRGAHWDGYGRVMATGKTRYGSELLRVPALHADGERRSVAFTVSLVRGDDGQVAGIAAVVRDETERWAEERELRRRLRAAEGAADVEDAGGSTA